MFFRLMVTAEATPTGSSYITDPDQFQYSVGGQMYRIESPSFPVAPGSLNLAALRNPVLQTYDDGKYTNNLSACVTPTQPVPKGVYLLVVSTFTP